MNTQRNRLYFPLLAFTIFVMVTLACSVITPGSPGSDTSQPVSGSTLSPVDTYTPIPVASSTPSPVSTSPKPGHWANENPTQGEAMVAFDLSEGGIISNYTMTAYVGVPNECTLKIDRLQMQVNEDGTFVISYSMEYKDVEAELGPAVMSLMAIPTGQPHEVLHISGNTTDTMMKGTYEITVCMHAFFSGPTRPWNTQWKNP